MAVELKPGDERTALKKFYCARPECHREIKVMAFRQADDFCSVNCQKLAQNPDFDLRNFGRAQ